MKRKVLASLLSVFIFISLWAKGPEKNFHYEYHDKDEGYSLNTFGLYSGNLIKNIKDDDKLQVNLYRENNIDYIVFYYKKNAPLQMEIKDMLRNSQNIWKDYDEKNGRPGVCHIFLDENRNFLFSAKYCEY